MPPGPIVESRLDVGRGPVATMLVQRGTLRVGDAIVAGDAAGKVRALYDYRGEKVKEAGPGEPVEILGFDRPPPAGELARVVEHERQAKDLAEKRAERLRREQLAQRSQTRGVSLETLFERMQEGAVQELNVVLKGDVQGSVEALMSELGKIQHPEVRVNVIHTGVGGITENDINLASASNALVVGFNVRPSAEARQLAEREGVDIRTYRVIYQLTEDIEQALVGMLSPVTTEEIARRGRGARALQGVASRDDRRLHGHERRRPARRAACASSATARSSTRRRSRSSSGSRRTRARSQRASSAASCSRASTTSRKATSSRSTRHARSSAPTSPTPPPASSRRAYAPQSRTRRAIAAARTR